MSRMKLKCYYILSILLFFTASANGAFNDIGVGARPLGLGGAFVALADDSNAANYNAAGLAYIDEIQIGATYAQRFNGLVNYNTISGIAPIGSIGTLGGNIGILSENSDIYQEQSIRITYGRKLFQQMSLGLNLKYFSTNYDSENEFVRSNPYFTETSSSAISLDVGLLAKPLESLNLGLSLENLIPADVSISDINEGSVPLNIRMGLSFRLESIAELSVQGAVVSNMLKSSLATIEVSYRNGEIYEIPCPEDEVTDIPGCQNGEEKYEITSPSQISIGTGIEMWVNPSIGVRGGYGMIIGGNQARTINLGGSAKIPIGGTALQLDYGFQLLTGDLQDNTTQRFSVNLLF